MKSIALSIGLLLFATVTEASQPDEFLMAICDSETQTSSLYLSRQELNGEVGFIDSFDSVHGYERIPADITYTNAGARAIFSYDLGEQLIVVGTGKSSLVFRSQNFNCETNF